MLKWRPIIVQGRICVDMLESNVVNGVAGLEALKHGSFNSFFSYRYNGKRGEIGEIPKIGKYENQVSSNDLHNKMYNSCDQEVHH